MADTTVFLDDPPRFHLRILDVKVAVEPDDPDTDDASWLSRVTVRLFTGDPYAEDTSAPTSSTSDA